jgi:predicted RNA-binding protein YlxR (DUF448 family)
MDELVRVARDERGRLVLGRDRPGRGAWLCRSSAACVDRAIERRAFNRAFRVRLQEAQVDRDRLVAGSAPASARGGGSEGSAR